MTAFVDGGVTPAELILDHARRRVGAGPVPEGSVVLGSARLLSPTCGDAVAVSVVVTETGWAVHWDGRGCEVSQAGASLLAELVTGPDDESLIDDFLAAMRTRTPNDRLGDAAALLSLAGNPLRAKCATLAWRAAAEALGEPR